MGFRRLELPPSVRTKSALTAWSPPRPLRARGIPRQLHPFRDRKGDVECMLPASDHDRRELRCSVPHREQRAPGTCRVSVAIVEPKWQLHVRLQKMTIEVGREYI